MAGYNQMIVTIMGVAFVFHTMSMLTKGGYPLSTKQGLGAEDKKDTIQGLLISAFVFYGLALLLALLVAFAEFRHPLFKYICALLGILGALLAIAGVGVYETETDNANAHPYGSAVYVVGAVAAVVGAIVCVVSNFVQADMAERRGISNGMTSSSGVPVL